MAQETKKIVERLAIFLKERELKGVARLFFKNGRLLLELILYNCRIGISYSLLTEALSTQVIVIITTVGGTTGFSLCLSWVSVGASLVAPPVLISTLFLKGIAQQIVNRNEYSTFKKLVSKMLDDSELKETIRAFFIEEEVSTTLGIEMKTWDSDKNTLLEFNFDSDQTLGEFIKARMKEELGLVENPTTEQFKEIMYNRKKVVHHRNNGKTVYFKDFIKEIAKDPNDIIDVEIVKETIKSKVQNEEL